MPTRPAHVLIANGPNLNLLGEREPQIYGRISLAQIEERCRHHGQELSITVDFFQTNDESEMIERIHQSNEHHHGIIINAGAWTHTSIALLDALNACPLPAIEVHISNIWKREKFRHHSYIAAAALGCIGGFGLDGYLLALSALRQHLSRQNNYAKRKHSSNEGTTGTS